MGEWHRVEANELEKLKTQKHQLRMHAPIKTAPKTEEEFKRHVENLAAKVEEQRVQIENEKILEKEGLVQQLFDALAVQNTEIEAQRQDLQCLGDSMSPDIKQHLADRLQRQIENVAKLED